eukprot:7104501-Pyramimonas_sp.AAC.1
MCRPPVCCDCRWVARLARCPASRSPANQTPERKRQMRNQGENWSTPGGLSTEYSDVAHCTGTGGSMVRCGRNGGESWKLGAAADFTITTRKSEGGGLELQQVCRYPRFRIGRCCGTVVSGDSRWSNFDVDHGRS